MTLPIQVKPIMTQEKGEKYVFRKNKKYRTLCSVALGTVATAVLALGGGVAKADELLTPSAPSTVLTDNPATNLPEAQPTETVEHNTSLSETGQSQGTMPVTIDETPLKQAIAEAKAEGVTITSGQDMDLGITQTAEETNQALDTAKSDMDKQVSELKDVTAKYQSDKADHAAEVARIEGENAILKVSHTQAEAVAKNLEKDLNVTVSDLTNRFSNAKVTVTDKTITSGDGTSPEAYEGYTKLVQGVSEQNKAAIDTYVTKKTEADAQTAKNKQIEAENAAGLAKAKEDNDAITKRNQAGQAAIDEENRRGQAAVDQANKDKQARVTNRQAEIEAIKKAMPRNRQKQTLKIKTSKPIMPLKKLATTENWQRLEREKRAIFQKPLPRLLTLIVENLKPNTGQLLAIPITLLAREMLCWVVIVISLIRRVSLFMTSFVQGRLCGSTIRTFKTPALRARRLQA